MMLLNKCVALWFLNVIVVASTQDDVVSNELDIDFSPIKVTEADANLLQYKILVVNIQQVKIQLYYECLCPDCRNFDTTQLVPTVQKLSPYLDIHLYPFGNAKIINKENHYEFQCQHGPEECYGNKLHACAIDILGNVTEAIFFNSCMMESSQQGRGSDDAAADVCGKSMNVDASSIKQCAKGARGNALLKFYGEESKKIGFKYVPYILINGVQNNGDNFMKDVCAAYVNPPPPCTAA